MSDVVPPTLTGWLRDTFDDPTLAVRRYDRLAGGAIQQNMALDVARDGGASTEALVLRTDAPSGVSVSRTRAEEHALLAAAFDAGVTVPEPLALCTDERVLGRPFFLMRRVSGTTHPVRLTRGDDLEDGDRESLVDALGAELARIHAVPLDAPGLRFLSSADAEGGAAGGHAPVRRVARYRRLLDELGAHRPVLEWALSWLERQTVTAHGPTLCHNDFRTGNLMIGTVGANAGSRTSDGSAEGPCVTGVLDWEFAAVGDPHEDIGWFCAPCWRFAAREREAGGLGSREAFYAGYERASGRTIDRAAVPIWEIVATVRWAVIALQQGARFTSGAEPTLELGLTGRMIAELEQDVLTLVLAASNRPEPEPDPGIAATGERGMAGVARLADDAPSGAALLASARRTFLDRLLPTLPDERRYEGLMIANAMGVAERELAGRRDVFDENERIELCRRLRRGIEGSDEELVARLGDDVVRRLRLANPKRVISRKASS